MGPGRPTNRLWEAFELKNGGFLQISGSLELHIPLTFPIPSDKARKHDSIGKTNIKSTFWPLENLRFLVQIQLQNAPFFCAPVREAL